MSHLVALQGGPKSDSSPSNRQQLWFASASEDRRKLQVSGCQILFLCRRVLQQQRSGAAAASGCAATATATATAAAAVWFERAGSPHFSKENGCFYAALVAPLSSTARHVRKRHSQEPEVLLLMATGPNNTRRNTRAAVMVGGEKNPLW